MLKSRHITVLTKVPTVKAMVFPVVMYRCESWIIKKADSWRTDAFQLWCWRRLLRVQGDWKEIKPVNPKGNQSWIFIGRTDAEAPTLWPPDVKSQLIGKDPDAGEDWGQEEKGAENEMVREHHQLNVNLSKFLEIVKDREARHAAAHEAAKSQIRLNNWATTKWSEHRPVVSNSCDPID